MRGIPAAPGPGPVTFNEQAEFEVLSAVHGRRVPIGTGNVAMTRCRKSGRSEVLWPRFDSRSFTPAESISFTGVVLQPARSLSRDTAPGAYWRPLIADPRFEPGLTLLGQASVHAGISCSCCRRMHGPLRQPVHHRSIPSPSGKQDDLLSQRSPRSFEAHEEEPGPHELAAIVFLVPDHAVCSRRHPAVL